MTFKYYVLPILLILIACDNTDEPISVDKYLIAGKWKKTNAYISAGGPQYWIDVENGEEIEFFENGTFSSNRYNECSIGAFSIEENKLLLKYNCVEFSTGNENKEGFITYKLDFFSNYFILTPTSGPICTEGCSSKYQKKE
ncbi:hypothetical protein [Thalassobellus citreus]|uniref:hypothetical protein n=1 Tax=Thalassobellus citreus TaxID=3367752 RepID=UPI0037B401F9